ncbi:MAG: hypothetical protein GC160_16905 [Acidobacteria bacterium]|nr:hypothetical protein [Acidobacteriota bacterium]
MSAAAELEFSHQLHLGKVGLQCNVCHASVAGSDAATDNNLPQAQLCLVCHNGETAPKVDVAPLEDRTPAPRSFSFSHQQHLELGNVAAKLAEAIDNGAYLGPVPDIRAQLDAEGACVGCHRGMEQSTAVDASVDLPHMADCLVCHDQIDNPFTCETCHAPDFPIKPENHTREFIDAHSTGVLTAEQKLTCQPCHGRNFRCMGCH